MNNLCADIGYNSLNKYGEQLCGDKIEIITDTSPNQPSHYHAQLDWLLYVKTKKVKRYLINYFKDNYLYQQ